MDTTCLLMFKSANYLLIGQRGYSGKAEASTLLAEADFRTSFANVIRPNRPLTQCRRFLSECHSDRPACGRWPINEKPGPAPGFFMEADGQDIPPRQNRRFQRFYRAMEAGRHPARLKIDAKGRANKGRLSHAGAAEQRLPR
ncbi:hypothetical protein AB4Z51_43685 [Bradyrhizobium sp. 2TAF36]